MTDLRYALCGLVKSAEFTGVAILSLALGIGANTAIRAVLLDALPVKAPEQLVELGWRHEGQRYPMNAIYQRGFRARAST